MLTQLRTKLPGGHRLQARSSHTPTCTGATRRHRDGQPRSSRPMTWTSVRHPETDSPGPSQGAFEHHRTGELGTYEILDCPTEFETRPAISSPPHRQPA